MTQTLMEVSLTLQVFCYIKDIILLAVYYAGLLQKYRKDPANACHAPRKLMDVDVVR